MARIRALMNHTGTKHAAEQGVNCQFSVFFSRKTILRWRQAVKHHNQPWGIFGQLSALNIIQFCCVGHGSAKSLLTPQPTIPKVPPLDPQTPKVELTHILPQGGPSRPPSFPTSHALQLNLSDTFLLLLFNFLNFCIFVGQFSDRPTRCSWTCQTHLQAILSVQPL